MSFFTYLGLGIPVFIVLILDNAGFHKTAYVFSVSQLGITLAFLASLFS
ncbi:hypothetical protein J5U21_01969 [Saccharolobus shibatae]|uniref:Uncharacterized protein n=1 Tax=Saccharolobus shibatae TaxID=2286 RepID=A0A8F5BVY2_9CREN|nr:hypothetical protein J5U21_01969 [Saccharolobus shibatae]